MLTLIDDRRDFSRRSFLRVGSLALGGLASPQLLAAKAAGAANAKVLRDKAVVFLFMHGGPSQIETFDPKMSAPAEIRSVTGEVQTTIPGVTFGGTFPRLAERTKRLAIVRSFSFENIGNHDLRPLVGPESFVRHVRSELDEIAKTSVGAKLLGTPGTTAAGDAWRSKFKVVISLGKTCRAEPTHIMNGWKKGSYIMYDHLGLPVTHGNKGTGIGCGTKLEYNPAQALPSESWFKNMPTALLLAHELIHAYLYARGEADPTQVDDIRNHERQVVGLPPFENGEITENKLRSQWKPPQPKRSQYTKWKRR